MSAQGLVRQTSRWNFDDTIARLLQSIESKGITLLARVDHGADARRVGLELRDTTVLIFGNPRGGTPLMVANQETGIDLPLRILVWNDADGKTRIAYNAPDWIAQRHGLDAGLKPVIDALTGALDAICQTVTG